MEVLILACAPHNLSNDVLEDRSKESTPSLPLGRGIGCEACSSHWTFENRAVSRLRLARSLRRGAFDGQGLADMLTGFTIRLHILDRFGLDDLSGRGMLSVVLRKTTVCALRNRRGFLSCSCGVGILL